MISLVKNELIKILHKKGLYIYGIIIIVIMGFTLIIDKFTDSNDFFDSYSIREESLKDYDLNDREELEWYVEERSSLDTDKIARDYDIYSPERYYIENDISGTISMMNTAKYIEKNDELYKMYQEEYNSKIKRLDNFDWRIDVEGQKAELEEELTKLKSMEESSEYKSRIEEIGYELEGINYRLKNDVAPSYSPSSSLVTSYVSNAIEYNSINKDEKTYTNRDELRNKRALERKYFISKYKIENNIVDSNGETFQEDYVSDLSSASTFFIIAMVIIAGGIFAEEFNKGTIKQLLVKPFSRTQIYLSKIIAIFIVLLMFILFYCSVTFVYYALADGNVGTIFNPIIDYSFKTHSIVEHNVLSYVLLNFVAILPQIVILTFVCTFAGIIATSTVGAVISVFGLTFLNGILSVFLPSKILSFLPMNCWDFTSYLTHGMSFNEYGNFGSSLAICVITVVLLFGLGLFIFNKKDIKNQ